MHEERKTKPLSIRRKLLTLLKWNAPYSIQCSQSAQDLLLQLEIGPTTTVIPSAEMTFFLSVYETTILTLIYYVQQSLFEVQYCVSTINSLSGVIICHRIFSDEPLSAVDLPQDELVDQHGSSASLRMRSQLRKHKYSLERNRAYVCSAITWQFWGGKVVDELGLRCPDCEYLYLSIKQ